ncbi:MAG: PhnA domain-containing protein [Desulfotalea sp.]
MSVESEVLQRSESKCELCNSPENLSVIEVGPESDGSAEQAICICDFCKEQIQIENGNVNHWRCLNDTMWSQVPAVQVSVWRILSGIKGEAWPQDLLEMLYLEDDVIAWAKAGIVEKVDTVCHLDSNGVALAQGDAVTLIKDLNVKGAGFTAKRGTTVRNISLVEDNAEHIEGRVDGQRIVILTKFVKKVG